VMVDVEGDREKVLVRGPKWVSFNSVAGHVSRRAKPHLTPSRRIEGAQEYLGKTAIGRDRGEEGDILLVSFHDMVKGNAVSRNMVLKCQ
jgi:hypothetical protein